MRGSVDLFQRRKTGAPENGAVPRGPHWGHLNDSKESIACDFGLFTAAWDIDK